MSSADLFKNNLRCDKKNLQLPDIATEKVNKKKLHAVCKQTADIRLYFKVNRFNELAYNCNDSGRLRAMEQQFASKFFDN